MRATKFQQVPYTYAQIRSEVDLSLQFVLNITGTKGNVADYAFWIYSESMAAAVRLLSDEAIIATYDIYCQNDDVVEIIVRSKDDPSPNVSQSPSHQSSLAERKETSHSRGLPAPDLFVQPKVEHVAGSSDASTLEPIENEDIMVTLRDGKQSVTFSRDYLVGWIRAGISDLKSLTDIIAESYMPDGTIYRMRLTDDVWQHSLLRGPWSSAFAPIWDTYIRNKVDREQILHELAERNPKFRKQCRDFIQDLRTFGTNKGAQKRLESSGHQYYIGKPYFEDAVRDEIMALPTQGRTLEEVLNALAEKENGGTICAGHTLAPLFESVLNVEWDRARGSAVISPLPSVQS